MIFQVACNLSPHTGVDHDKAGLRSDLEDDGVVDHVPLRAEEGTVNAAPLAEWFFARPDAGRQIVGKARLHQSGGFGAAYLYGRHMAGVENAGTGEHGQVFVLDRGVPQGHFVTAEVGHVGPAGKVPGV